MGLTLELTQAIHSDRSNFFESLERVLIAPADGGFPGGRRLRGDVVRVRVESGGIVWQHQVQVRRVDVRLIPIDQCDAIHRDSNVARVAGVSVDDARRTPHEPRPRCSAASDALGRDRTEVELCADVGDEKVGRRSPAGTLRPTCVNRCNWRSVSATRGQSASVSGGRPSM
jgi:hypothetical protein